MLVDLVQIKTSKKEAIRKMQTKTPLLSKIVEFNDKIEDIQLKYIEYKILKYRVVNENIKMTDEETKYEVIILNMFTGNVEITKKVPETVKRYISKDCIEEFKVEDYLLAINVKNEINKYYKKYNSGKLVLAEVFSIYKPYWIGIYNNKKILIDAYI